MTITSVLLPKIVTDVQQLIPIAKKAKEIRIATFGLYVGYMGKIPGQENMFFPQDNAPARMLQVLSTIESSIIVGLPEPYECRPGCPDCQLKNKRSADRISVSIKRFPNINWNLRTQWHAKWYLFKTEHWLYGWTGGINMTGSSWDDMLVSLPLEISSQFWEIHENTIKEIK